ncbi:hypothetical protein PR003_g30852 [Phytophthora rubi]|uniref:Transposase Helix-turn-helix domain-containing protein n=1 Tax=Phytophthora rubi TaxID=129364 RepID=A0A6A4B7U3_9STRA|nr:hypothetical protein PR001_g29721 [Phytophthora rubi]KAE8962562.1 hypothetical protein PR002_g29563 [Phytophthora rubi]KAE9270367.1 hypothetical protein PR003_g30852 [Phytophthora rubi]
MVRQSRSVQPARGCQPARDAQVQRDHVEAVLSGIIERRITREQELAQYPTTTLHYVEGEDTDTPHFDRFRDVGGSAAIEDMTNFTTREFNELWLSIRDFVVVNYNVGRGRRSPIKAKDAFFMTLVTLKEGGTWHSLSEIFGLATASFTETVTKFIEMLAPPKLYVEQVQGCCDHTLMRAAATSGNTFSNFPCAL